MGSGNCRWRGREGAWCGVAAALVLLLSGCHSSGLPKPATQAYLDEVTAFYVGLAALQVGDDVRADSTLQRATQLAEGEPAGWANWGERRSWRRKTTRFTICPGCSKANAAILRRLSSNSAKRSSSIPIICAQC